MSGKGEYLADFFAGCGRVSAAARRMGFTSREWELCRGEGHDLTRASVLKSIHRDISSKKIVAAMLATPCTSFSVARDRTRVIRTAVQPWGVDMTGASENDVKSLISGNATCWATIKILRALNAQRIPWIMENPHSSRIWHIPELRREFARAKAHFVTTDFCQWGTAWRKRTLLVCGNIDACDVAGLNRMCSGNKGICSRSQRKHHMLTGSNEKGIPWTRVAQPYPAGLARQLASSLLSAAKAQRTYNRDKL